LNVPAGTGTQGEWIVALEALENFLQLRVRHGADACRKGAAELRTMPPDGMDSARSGAGTRAPEGT
jgi:hypothetical protein